MNEHGGGRRGPENTALSTLVRAFRALTHRSMCEALMLLHRARNEPTLSEKPTNPRQPRR